MKYYLNIFVIGLGIIVTAGQAAADPAAHNVVWTSPSENSHGSMPLGGGDLGVNVWTENGRDLVFYVGKTDAWDENAALLKLGKVRVVLPEGTFAADGPFRQELRLQDGTIHIDAGRDAAAIRIIVWADVNNPAVHIDIQRASPCRLEVKFEPWRLERRQLTGEEVGMAYGLCSRPEPVFIEPDTVVSGLSNRITWYHRNQRSIWAENLRMQAIDPENAPGGDPLLGNTFGAAIIGENLTNIDAMTLRSVDEAAGHVISIHALTAQTKSADEWLEKLDAQIAKTNSVPYSERKAAADRWWDEFNRRSYIRISGDERAEAVSRGYALQRALNAFAGRGKFPIKFNGSIFNVDTHGRKELGKESGLSADYRRWGGPYWLQNTRLIYWPMLHSGDFELMRPFFELYLRNLDMARLRVKTYYGPTARGAYFPETITHWGTWTGDNFGWKNPNPQSGVAENLFIRYEWQGGLEVSAMMLQYFEMSGDRQFLREKILPFIAEILTFYDTHYGRDEAGRLRLEPAQALETFRVAVNPMPEVAGLHYVLGKLLELPRSEIDEQLFAQCTRLKSELPELPTRTVDGKTIFAPGQTFSGKQNHENPELYCVFPYPLSGVGMANLPLGIETFNRRTTVQNAKGWSQDPIQAALLGLTEKAKDLVYQGFSTKDAGSRFPGFHGPNFDWVPDNDQPGSASIALQRMILQADGGRAILFPTWPKDWNVEFRLFGPRGKIFMGRFADGKVQWLDPNADGRLTAADARLIEANLGYDNRAGAGDMDSLAHGDVNYDGRVDNADLTALQSASAAQDAN
jgi:alpha-L-fucosidase 2